MVVEVELFRDHYCPTCKEHIKVSAITCPEVHEETSVSTYIGTEARPESEKEC